jgi:hypothetical protein
MKGSFGDWFSPLENLQSVNLLLAELAGVHYAQIRSLMASSSLNDSTSAMP